MGGQQAKQLFSPSGKQRVGSNREFVIAIIDIAARHKIRKNKNGEIHHAETKNPPNPLF